MWMDSAGLRGRHWSECPMSDRLRQVPQAEVEAGGQVLKGADSPVAVVQNRTQRVGTSRLREDDHAPDRSAGPTPI